jgi:hypothetical protein
MPANPDFDDIATTTLRNRSGKTADNATKTTSFTDRMRRKGKVRPADGGRTITQELEVALNPNGSWYSGADELNTLAFEPFSAAEYDWKLAAVPCFWSGQEKLMNSGEFQTINLITGRVKNSEKSLIDMVSTAAYSDGTTFGGKSMHGLGLFVVTTPTSGTVGGIPRADNTFWRNQSTSVTGITANIAVSNPSNFVIALGALSINCTRGADRPDLYVADALHYQAYINSLGPYMQIRENSMAGYGFTAVKYYGVGASGDVVLDNGYAPANTTFALNTDYLYLRTHPDRDFVVFGGDRVPVNQDGTLRFVGVMGNFCASNLARQGKLFQN